MIRNQSIGRRITVALAALFIFAAGALAQGSRPPFQLQGTKKAAENKYFAIWKVTFEKGESTGMRKLPLDQVTVFFNRGPVKFTRPDGTWWIQEEKMGSVLYQSKGTVVAEEGLGALPTRAIIFQLKDVAPPNRPIVPGVPDKFPREGATMLFETKRVQVWDYTWLHGMKTPYHLHYHVDAVVYLVGGETRVTTPHGPQIHVMKAGEVLAGTKPLPAPHQESWVEGSPRAISVLLR